MTSKTRNISGLKNYLRICLKGSFLRLFYRDYDSEDLAKPRNLPPTFFNICVSKWKLAPFKEEEEKKHKPSW